MGWQLWIFADLVQISSRWERKEGGIIKCHSHGYHYMRHPMSCVATRRHGCWAFLPPCIVAHAAQMAWVVSTHYTRQQFFINVIC